MIERLDPPVSAADLDDLASLLVDAVAGNASVGFPADLGLADARAWWELGGARVLLVARDAGRLVGTAQLRFSAYPNGRHRAEVAKVMVHSSARRRGIASQLMAALEAEALAAGKTLLYLDTESGSPAGRLYRRLGWTAAGTIPDFAYRPDGELRPSTYFYKRLSF